MPQCLIVQKEKKALRENGGRDSIWGVAGTRKSLSLSPLPWKHPSTAYPQPYLGNTQRLWLPRLGFPAYGCPCLLANDSLWAKLSQLLLDIIIFQTTAPSLHDAAQSGSRRCPCTTFSVSRSWYTDFRSQGNSDSEAGCGVPWRRLGRWVKRRLGFGWGRRTVEWEYDWPTNRSSKRGGG